MIRIGAGPRTTSPAAWPRRAAHAGLRRARRPRLVLLALLQSAILTAAPLADPPPLPGHSPHLAAETEPGCAPVHDDLHCLVCRVAASDRLAGSGAIGPVAAATTHETLEPPADRADARRPAATPDRIRAPPRA